MTAPSIAVPAPERATPTAPHRAPESLNERLTAVSTLMDDRLALAALAVAVNTAVSVPDVGPVGLADAVCVPTAVQPYRPPVDLYPTPVAAVLQRARARLERDGWCRGATVDQDGARCLYGALRAEAASTAELHDALAVLLETIHRHFPDEETVPGFNDGRYGPRVVFRVLDQAADLAHARDL
ncbi:hypothetical protein ACFWH4_10655 [Streptomyces sp. NPDC127091]|uniref:DUF6197 family protein n=1 Tax=Streptomyces sp. NPDC127091 TaxID=3347134 RepID=UPI003660A078